MKSRHWQVWIEKDGIENILFSGSHARCLAFYRQHGGASSELHIGYPLEEE